MAYDANGKLIPGLAKSVKNPNPKTYVFTLRKHLEFQNGKRVTPAIVKTNLEYYGDKKTGSGLYTGLKYIESIETGAHSVTVHLDGPDTAFLQWLAVPTAAIVPKSSLNKTTSNKIGAGPFKLTKYQPGIGMTFVKFKKYYGAKSVKLHKIEMKFYADAQSRVNALTSGDVDLIDYVPWPNWNKLAKTPGVTVAGQQGPFQYVQFNVTKKPFSNPKVRQAVAYAVNRKNSVAAAFQGHGKPLDGVVIPKSDPAYDPQYANLWSHDPAKAKKLLAQAGYPNGFKATLLTTSQYQFLEDLGLSVQSDLKAIGIDVKMDSPDWATRTKKGNSGDYDLAVSGGAGRITDPSYLMGHVSGPANYNNSYGYDNPKLNAALLAGLRASTPTEKKAAYGKAQQIIKTDVPFASLNTRSQAFAYSSKVKGFKNLPGFLTFYGGYSFPDVHMTK
ncbi:ABC transporter substrate-binding protein [Spelaeicoccus albus]|uniref:ABC transporter substrate-binding protein n=1 Tax=Spelaeicoccus albus TaxID=1280376 RepID=UPI001F288BAB|nr:ABC transporter substrate-binding protein [Spelaeicoccus albus]